MLLEAYAAFANNDGTNIYPSQEKLGKKAGTSADTFQRVTPHLIESGILKRAETHVCRVATCSKGSWHFSGQWGRSTKVYEIQLGNLQNAVSYLTAKCGLVNATKCGTTQALIDSARAALTLGKEPDSSASSPSGSEIASESVTLADKPLASTAPSSLREASQNLTGVGDRADQNQNQPRYPQTDAEMLDGYSYADCPFNTEIDLLFAISPNLTDAAVLSQLPACTGILAYFERNNRCNRKQGLIAATMLLKHNRVHRSGKYATKDDGKLYIRTAKQFLAALESESATLMNDYDQHMFDECELCKEHKMEHCIQAINKAEAQKAEQEAASAAEAARLAEEQRLARLCPICKQREPGEMSIGGFSEILVSGLAKVARGVCDECYDERFEAQQKRGVPVKEVLMVRPGYLEAKNAEQRRRRQAEEEANELDIPVCAQCGQITHSRSCPAWRAKTQDATA